MSNRYVGGVITETVNVAQAPWSGEWTEQAQLQAKAQGTWAPYTSQIGNSLRFRSSASAYLTRTPASATNQQKWTWSGWVKRGALGSAMTLFAARTGVGATYSIFRFGTDTLVFEDNTITALTTASVYRDPSAWYHIVLAVDTTQATAANRTILYVNGVQVAWSTGTYPTQNANLQINSTNTHLLGQQASGQYFDGYLAEVNFIDGQALTPSYFGMFDSQTGVWKPTVYGGTYGTNGFKLNFSNGTSTTTLGYDSSGNGNNWTTNNISLTSGSTYDWMIDSPTPFAGSSYGVGNYAVLNPLDPNVSGTSVTISNGNLTASGSTYGASVYTASMQIPSSGKWYYETVYTAITSLVVIGIRSYTTGSTDVQYRSDGQKTVGSTTSAYGSSWTTNDVIAVAVDRDSGTVTFYKNNTSQGAISIPTNSAAFDMAWNVASPYGSTTFAVTYGQRPFAYTPPTGYKSLCTYNLPAASIVNGASYMAATLYTGTGVAQSLSNAVNGVSFAPGFVWLKTRSTTSNNYLFDSVRGAGYELLSNSTSAENYNTDTLTSFNSNGFSIGTHGTLNGNGYTEVGWNWKANGTAVSNTAGSITSQVSSNTTSGFSVVTYTGTGANATVGHGLGVAPSMVIIKNRTGSGTSWITYHSSLPTPATQALYLNTTDSVQTSSLFWNSTAPTSSVFSLAAYIATNQNTSGFVAYCFAAIPGYSAFGSFSGNGSTDGTFVYCGFRPRFVLIKCTSATYNWTTFDSSRIGYNSNNYRLFPNLSNAEESTTQIIDLLSNGFKARTTDGGINVSGGSFIYAAFAESPFQNSLAR